MYIDKTLVNKFKKKSFRDKIKKNPELLFEFTHQSILKNVELELVEDTETTLHFVIPLPANDLNNNQIEIINAGRSGNTVSSVGSVLTTSTVSTASSFGSVFIAGATFFSLGSVLSITSMSSAGSLKVDDGVPPR